MKRFSTLVWMLVIVGSAFLLYRVKYEVQNLRTQVSATERELAAERESLHVVAAEWAYLNRPDRLARLSEKYLSSKRVMANQVAEVEAVPFPSKIEAAANTSTQADGGIKPVSAVLNSDKRNPGDAE